jgi:hypothetical protein
VIARATTGAAPRCTIFRFRSRSSPCWGAFLVVVALIQIGILRYAYLRIGVSSRAAMALLLGSLLGGEQLDILTQRALVALEGENVIGILVEDFLGDAAMGNPPAWRLHDLRRTFVAGLADLGIKPDVIEMAVNHASGLRGGIAGVYNKSELMPSGVGALGGARQRPRGREAHERGLCCRCRACHLLAARRLSPRF